MGLNLYGHFDLVQTLCLYRWRNIVKMVTLQGQKQIQCHFHYPWVILSFVALTETGRSFITGISVSPALMRWIQPQLCSPIHRPFSFWDLQDFLLLPVLSAVLLLEKPSTEKKVPFLPSMQFLRHLPKPSLYEHHHQMDEYNPSEMSPSRDTSLSRLFFQRGIGTLYGLR